MEKYRESNRRYVGFTTRDNKKLQTLQNKVNRMLVPCDFDTPTADLLQLTDSLSVHQMVAYQTLVMTHKIAQTRKPSYIADKIRPTQSNLTLRGGSGLLKIPEYKLSNSREGFIYRGTYIHNLLDEITRNEPDIENFKKSAREWVKNEISIKPTSYFSSILQRKQNKRETPVLNDLSTNQAPRCLASNPITRYFKPIKP